MLAVSPITLTIRQSEVQKELVGGTISEKIVRLDTNYPIPCTIRDRIVILLFYIVYNFLLTRSV